MARQSFRASSGDENQKINLPPSADELPDSVSVDLDGSDPNAFEIIEEDDTPEADRGRPTEYDPDPNFDEEVENLRTRGKKTVEGRISRLKFERETERRAKEAAIREREAAIEMARAAQAEAQALRGRVEQSGAVLADSMLSRNESALREAKQLLKMAYAAGDTDAIADAQTAISRLQPKNWQFVSVCRPLKSRKPVGSRLSSLFILSSSPQRLNLRLMLPPGSLAIRGSASPVVKIVPSSPCLFTAP